MVDVEVVATGIVKERQEDGWQRCKVKMKDKNESLY